MNERNTETANAAMLSCEEAVEWIISLSPGNVVKPGLARITALLERLDNPQHRLKFIHIAGTNGKGSVCAYLTQVLRQCGYDVGTFTSPYIERFTNRIRYNMEDIPDDILLKLANEVRPHVEEIAATEIGSPSMFDVSTAIALLYYTKETYPDYVVWETGLGGRLDSTNVVYPVVSVITNIGHDHMEILGDTLEKVAAEKAAIIKSGVPVVSAVSQPGTIQVIEDEAKAKKSRLYLLNRDFRVKTLSSEENDQHFRFEGPFRPYEDIGISMNGSHQIENAAVSVMVLEVLRQYLATLVDEEDLLAGMAAASWPGRLEMISRRPRILLDGAHNPEGAQTLAAALKTVYRYKKLHLMTGMLASKNHSGFLRHILPLVDTIIVTEADFRTKLAAADFAAVVERVAGEIGCAVPEMTIEPHWPAALERLGERVGPDDLGVVAGTLYLISDVRSWILYERKSEKGW